VWLFISCNFFTEPEPFVNKQADPLKNALNPFYNFTEGQSVSGIIRLLYTLDEEFIPLDHISLYVDSTFIGSKDFITYYNNPGLFDVDTRQWPDGRHTIFLFVFKQQGSLGPRRVYSITLIFDQGLTTPMNVSIIIENNHPRISWTPIKMVNFNSYVIRRSGNVIATLQSRNDSTYIDTKYTCTDFYRINYDIGATTNGSTSYSPIVTLVKGESLSLNQITSTVDDLNDEVAFQTSKLITISTQTHTILAQQDISKNGMLSRSPDKSKIFRWVTKYSFSDDWPIQMDIFDAATLQGLGYYSTPIRYNGIISFAVGPQNQTYFSGFSNTALDAFFYNDSTLVSILGCTGRCRFLSVSPDGRDLLAVDDKGVKSYLPIG
jgi:hypothetical protein